MARAEIVAGVWHEKFGRFKILLGNIGVAIKRRYLPITTKVYT